MFLADDAPKKKRRRKRGGKKSSGGGVEGASDVGDAGPDRADDAPQTSKETPT
jgi:hypothetical protein